MSTGGYKIRNQQGIHFITFAVVNWVDVFTRKEYKDLILDSLRHCQKEKGLIIYSWVIMSNHVHFIFSAKEGYELSNILRDFKKHTSDKVIKAIEQNISESRKDWMLSLFKQAGKKNSRNSCYQFWQQDNHPIELNSNDMIDQKLEYIHNNPVKAGIVEKAEDYIYSSAIDYYTGKKGLLEIEFLV
jgi:putative transposase